MLNTFPLAYELFLPCIKSCRAVLSISRPPPFRASFILHFPPPFLPHSCVGRDENTVGSATWPPQPLGHSFHQRHSEPQSAANWKWSHNPALSYPPTAQSPISCRRAAFATEPLPSQRLLEWWKRHRRTSLIGGINQYDNLCQLSPAPFSALRSTVSGNKPEGTHHQSRCWVGVDDHLCLSVCHTAAH